MPKNLAMPNVTELLSNWCNGDTSAPEELFPLVYQELKRTARRYLRRESPGHTFQTTDLVNEAYLKLVEQNDVEWQNRAHFYAISAQIMRRILIDHARARTRLRRGGAEAVHKVSIDEVAECSNEAAEGLLAVDEALAALARVDERRGKVVELRFFGGLNNEEIAEVLKISPNTVTRDWNMARAWLFRELSCK